MLILLSYKPHCAKPLAFCFSFLLLLLFQLRTLVSDFIIKWPCIPFTYIFFYEELYNYVE